MNILSFIAILALTITLVEGGIVLFRDHNSEIHRLFFLICISISMWLLGAGFGYSSGTREDAFFWLRISSPGFIFMHAFVLHFVSRYTGQLKGPVIYAVYIPSLVFLYISFTGYFVFSDIYRSGNSWVMVPDYDSRTFYIFMVNYLIYYIAALGMLYRYMTGTKSRRVRRQSRIIFIAITITIASYNIEPFLAPLFFDYHTYGQAPLYSIFWVSLLWYAMVKYRFLGAGEHHLYLDVLNSLHEMVLIIDSDKNIIALNSALSLRTGHEDKNVALEEIFVEHDLLLRQIDNTGDTPVTGLMLNLAVAGGGRSLVRGAISVIRDRFDDTIGHIIVLRGVRKRFSPLKKKGITGREYEMIQLIIAGNGNREIAEALNVTVRTVETHITHIFNKLGLKNRIQLINYCTNLFYTRDNGDNA